MTPTAPGPADLKRRLAARFRKVFQFEAGLAALALLAIGTAAFIAVRTRYHSHPDEKHHAYAFAYFEDHWWPPDLNRDDLEYDPTGNHRIYNGEIVYFIYGTAARALSPLLFDHNPDTFDAGSGVFKWRRFNTALLAAVLVFLFFTKTPGMTTSGNLRPDLKRIFGFTLCIIPQTIYIFGYANSDAFGLALAILLMLAAIWIVETPFARLTAAQAIALGILTGLILTSKLNYLAALFLPYALLAIYLWRNFRTGAAARGLVLRRAAGAGLLAVVVAFPLKIYYPLTQPDYRASRQAMLEARAIEGLKPSDPSFKGAFMASKGLSVLDVLRLNSESGRGWLYVSFESLYGVFGFMNVRPPAWVTWLGFGLAALAIGLTLFIEIRGWRENPSILKYAVVLAPAAVLVNLAASLYFSWTTNYQAQGRFLFPTIPALALLIFGISRTGPADRAPATLRTVVFVLLLLNAILVFSLLLQNDYLYLHPDFNI